MKIIKMSKRFIIVIILMCLCTIGNLVAFLSLKANSSDEEEYVVKSEDFFVDSALFTHKDDETIYNQDPEYLDLSSFTKKLENDNLELYSDKKTGAIRILNKDTGYYWCSDVYDINKYEINNKQKREMKSSFIMLYANGTKQTSVSASDTKFTLEEVVEGNTLKVNATFKDVEKRTEEEKKVEVEHIIKFSYEITLQAHSIDVVIKNDSIVEDETYKLKSITLFPYFGCSHGDDIPGYIFIPSGSGALIRYRTTSPITAQFESSFYGTDANVENNSETDSLSMPIYGVVHGTNQNAMFAEIKSGSAFAKLVYEPANVNIQGFNLIYTKYNFREFYQIKIPGSGNVDVISDDYYKQDIEVSYTFLSGNDANYVGMAKTYQQGLIQNGVLSPLDKISYQGDISLQLEAFGRDYERGLLFKKYKNMTTVSDILNIHAYLEECNINNVFYVLRAFNKGGYSNQSVSNYKNDGTLGRLSRLKDLECYFYYNPVESYNSKKSFPRNTLVNLLNEKNYIVVEKEKYKFYANLSAVEKYTKKAIDYYDEDCSIALDGIGYRLYGDKNNNLVRYESMDLISKLLGNEKYPLFTPNSYLLQNTSKYLNMPLYSSRYRFITDSVPFIAILLRGYVEYYSPYLNFSSNIDLDILKCIEYGVNPAFLVTSKPSYELANTLSSNYYATYYDNIKKMIKIDYDYINNALKEVNGETITNREIVEEGISVVTYSNGKKIIVNYTKNNYSYFGTNVSPLGYKVV